MKKIYGRDKGGIDDGDEDEVAGNKMKMVQMLIVNIEVRLVKMRAQEEIR
jgi:hypothetical protein